MTLSHMILSHTSFLCSKFRKEKKKKENINIDLAILPSYDTNIIENSKETMKTVSKTYLTENK